MVGDRGKVPIKLAREKTSWLAFHFFFTQGIPGITQKPRNKFTSFPINNLHSLK